MEEGGRVAEREGGRVGGRVERGREERRNRQKRDE